MRKILADENKINITSACNSNNKRLIIDNGKKDFNMIVKVTEKSTVSKGLFCAHEEVILR